MFSGTSFDLVRSVFEIFVPNVISPALECAIGMKKIILLLREIRSLNCKCSLCCLWLFQLVLDLYKFSSLFWQKYKALQSNNLIFLFHLTSDLPEQLEAVEEEDQQSLNWYPDFRGLRFPPQHHRGTSRQNEKVLPANIVSATAGWKLIFKWTYPMSNTC